MPPTGITLAPAPPGTAPLAVVLPAGVPCETASALEWEAYTVPGDGGVLVVARAVSYGCDSVRDGGVGRREGEGPLPLCFFANCSPPSAHLAAGPLSSLTQNADADYVGSAPPPSPPGAPTPTYALARLPSGGGGGVYARLACAATAPLAPRLTRLSYTHTAAGVAAPAAAASATPPTPADKAAARAAGKRALVQAYGSARARRKLAAADRGGVDAAAAGDGAAGVAGLLAGAAAVAGAAGGREAVLAAAASARPALPPHDAAATTPHTAYPLHGLVPPGGAAALDAWADGLAAIKQEGRVAEAVAVGAAAAVEAAATTRAAAQEADKDGAAADAIPPPAIHFHPHVLARLEGLPGDVDTPAGKRRVRALALLSAALRLAASPRTLRVDAGAWPAVAARVGVPEPLLAALLSRYADAAPAGRGTSFSRAGVHGVAIRVLAAVAAVLAADGDLPASDFGGLRAALAGPAKELASICREAGCRADAAAMVDGHRTYRVRLLVAEGGSTTLGDCFPKLKVGRSKK